MFFSEISDSSSSKGRFVKIGTCRVDGIEVRCVKKTYVALSEFEKMAYNLNKYKDLIKKVGPRSFELDSDNKQIFMEYIGCQSVKDYLVENIDALDPESDLKLQGLIKSIRDLIDTMSTYGVCHNDFHTENLLICADGTLKMIDFDDLTDLDGNCEDMNEIIGTMVTTLGKKTTSEESRVISSAKVRTQQKMSIIREKVTRMMLD